MYVTLIANAQSEFVKQLWIGQETHRIFIAFHLEMAGKDQYIPLLKGNLPGDKS